MNSCTLASVQHTHLQSCSNTHTHTPATCSNTHTPATHTHRTFARFHTRTLAHTQHTHNAHNTHTHTQHTHTHTQRHTRNTTQTQACGSRRGALLPECVAIYRDHILSIENIFYLAHYYSISHTGLWSRGGGTPSLLALPRLSRLLHPVLEPGG